MLKLYVKIQILKKFKDLKAQKKKNHALNNTLRPNKLGQGARNVCFLAFDLHMNKN